MLTRNEFSLIGDIFRRSGLYSDRTAQVQLSLSFACLLLAQVSTVLVPIILGWVVDALDKGQTNIIFLLVCGYALTRFTSRFAANFKEFLFDWATYGLLVRLYNNAFRHLLSLPYSFYVEGSTGSIAKAWDRGAWASEEAIDALIYRFFPMCLTAILTLGAVWFYHGWLTTFVLLVCMAVYIIWVQWSVKRVRIHMQRSNKFEDNLNRIAVDSFTNALSVKMFNGYRASEQRIATDFAGFRDENRRVSLASLILGSGGGLIVSVALGIIMALGYSRYTSGNITTGEFVALFTLANQVFMPISGIGRAYRDIKASLIKWDTLQKMLLQSSEFEDGGALEIDLSNKQIKFDKVSFDYGENTLLKDLSFDIEQGQTLAIVGPSGSGKSTLVKLLLGLWNPKDGAISVDGTPVQDFSLKSWRSNFGVVAQDPALLNDTIRNNILFGRSFATPEKAEEALKRATKAAEFHNFVSGLPKGYETLIGERGVKLSGGEAQRLAIARALVSDPPVLVFDEATSSLDTAVEREIQENLETISKDVTSVLIAHRLSTIVDADKIIVLDKGKVVEQGGHDALLAQSGLYAKLWNAQSKEN